MCGMSDVSLPLPDDWLAAIAAAVSDRLADRAAEADSSPWMTRPQAAEYLSMPLSRLEKDKTVPSHRWDGRVLYHRDELDAFVLSQG
jgi:hypothetical protein